jgi:RimJ/RimL family protein N-acetyltransferase
MPLAPTVSFLRLAFVSFDEAFLERSWYWLQDPEIKRLTLTPDFTREEQLRWFRGLPQMSNYQIWGISCEGKPIGALGLKHITGSTAEYWGYIGERSHWNLGLGKQMIQFALDKAKELGLTEVYLKVGRENSRAIRLYTRAGFRSAGERGDVLDFRCSLRDVHA